MKKIIVLFIGLSLVLGLWAYTKANGEEITVCVRRNGLMHVIGEGFRRTECRRNETLLSWNIGGEKGEKGDTGEKGEDGEDGTDLHLFDADGQDLGVLLDVDTSDNDTHVYTAFLPSIGLIEVKTKNNESILSLQSKFGVFFTDVDCSGNAFTILSYSGHLMNKISDGRYFTASSSTSEILTGVSLDDTNKCVAINSGTSTIGFLLKEVVLPFTEPLAWPLEIKSL